MKLIQSIYRLFVNLKQRTSRLFSLLIVCLAALFGLNPSANADRWYVDGTVVDCDNDGDSWTNAFKYLQDALAEAAANPPGPHEIWVAATATYYPDENCANPGGTDDAGLSFEMIAAVKVYGGFAGDELTLEDRDIVANETILSGEIGTASHDDNSAHVVSFLSLSGTAAVVDGFSIVDGDSGDFGGGVYVVSTDDAIIRNCVLQDNDALTGGGIGSKSDADCDINVINCYFFANEAYTFGGGAYSESSRWTFINATFTGNFVGVGGPNFNGGGAAFSSEAEVLFVNSLFYDNLAEDDGGAVYLFNSGTTAVFDNCTFGENDAGGNGGGIVADTSTTATITNCIFWGNTDGAGGTDTEEEQILDLSATDVTVSYTCVEGLDDYTGSGNIGVDPEFVAPGSNYRLLAVSPCIDAADNDAVECDFYDVDENDEGCAPDPFQDTPDLDFGTRKVDDPDTDDTGNGTPPIVDMGAYESVPCPWDLNGDCVVGAMDLTILLANWDNPYGAAELLALLAAWGACPCDPDAVVLSLDDELADACLSQADWDEYEDVMTSSTSSQADKDRYDCWMTHYMFHCNNCSCTHPSECPSPDPFSK